MNLISDVPIPEIKNKNKNLFCENHSWNWLGFVLIKRSKKKKKNLEKKFGKKISGKNSGKIREKVREKTGF